MRLRRVHACLVPLAFAWSLALAAAAPPPRTTDTGATRSHAPRSCLKRSRLGKCERWSSPRRVLAPAVAPGRAR